MRNFYIIIAFFLGLFGQAQEKVVVFSEAMFDTQQRIPLANQEGWIFKKGSEENWASPETNTTDWESMKLSEIHSDHENEVGRIEGWFRLKFKIYPSLANLELSLERELWAATDIYLNGELIHSFGETGSPYEAYNPILKYPKPIYLIPGQEYLLAVHFVDYETTITQREIRLKPENLRYFLNLTGPQYTASLAKDYQLTYVYATLCISISILFVFLFWLLVVLNPKQTIFKLIAILATIVFIIALSYFYGTFYEISYTTEKIRYVIMINFQALMVIFGLMILEWVLLRKITRISIILLFVVVITSDVAHLFSISLPFGIAFSALIVYFCYLLYTHKSIIKGGTLAVVAAIVVPVAAMIVYVNLHKFSLEVYNEYDNLINTIIILSSPLFLMIYIAMRFKEILRTATEEANKVLRVTEEKKELLADQNIKLENLVNERTRELKDSLENLKATQDQLIQSEKMASLGELTAGIAHEIQNPLNFVNNFSEVSSELIDEMNEEIEQGDMQEVRLIANDLKQNLDKINHHGKRADAIVKGMLQHSRNSTQEKQPTDLNKLIDEYLRLAYHGLRAKDKNFNANMETQFDESIGMLDLFAQEMGRVVLNLITNAFYAVNERKNMTEDISYQPMVSITTKKTKDQICIKVTDNGNGIPKHTIDKIFQPFFTTKPTGQGTGLGLSMSYDIVTKGHQGQFEVSSEVGKGTTFQIILPINPFS